MGKKLMIIIEVRVKRGWLVSMNCHPKNDRQFIIANHIMLITVLVPYDVAALKSHQ